MTETTDTPRVVNKQLLDTFRSYLPVGATVYTMDVYPKAKRNYIAFYCAYNGQIMRLHGMLANMMQQLGHTDVWTDHGNWQRHAALVTGSFYDYEIVRILATELYGVSDALFVGSL